jgi:hypothetical protein
MNYGLRYDTTFALQLNGGDQRDNPQCKPWRRAILTIGLPQGVPHDYRKAFARGRLPARASETR